jgi:hypothetical protein
LLDKATFGYGTDAITSESFGVGLDTTDQFFAGWATGLGGDGVLQIREGLWGESASKNHSGAVFTGGAYLGKAHGVALTVAGGVSVVKGLKDIGSGVQIGRGALQTVGGPSLPTGISVTITNPTVVAQGTGAVAWGAAGILTGGFSMASDPPDSGTQGASGSNPAGDLLKRKTTQQKFTDSLKRKYESVKNDPNLDGEAKLRELERLEKAIENAEENLTRLESELDALIEQLRNPSSNPPPGNP